MNELSFAFLKCLQPAADGGDRIFSEIHSANWWRDGEAHLPTPQHRLLSIILYVDGVSLDFFGNVHVMPIMLTFGNFPHHARESLRGKRLLGFVPYVDAQRVHKTTHLDVSIVRRMILHQACSRYVYQMIE